MRRKGRGKRPTEARMIYAITFQTVGGEWEHSAYRQTLRAARAWARWLASRKYVAAVKISRGNGGEIVD